MTASTRWVAALAAAAIMAGGGMLAAPAAFAQDATPTAQQVASSAGASGNADVGGTAATTPKVTEQEQATLDQLTEQQGGSESAADTDANAQSQDAQDAQGESNTAADANAKAAAPAISEDQLKAKNYILYAVNAGANRSSFPSNSIDRAEQYQGVAEPKFPDRVANTIPDQTYNADATKDSDADSPYSWGIVDPGSTTNPVKRGGSGNGWPYDTYWQTNVGNKDGANNLLKANPDYDTKGGVTYRFEIPQRDDANAVNKYNVRLGFHTGGRNRFLNVYANDVKKIDSLLLVANVKYVEGFQAEAKTDPATGKQVIDVRVQADTPLKDWIDANNDVQVKYIEVSAEPVYTKDNLPKLIEDTQDAKLTPLKSGYQADGQGTKNYTAPYDKVTPNAGDLKKLAAARATAEKVNADANATSDEIFDAYDGLKKAFDGVRFIYHYTGITGTNGAKIFDDNGTLIQAHGPQIQPVSVDLLADADKKLDANKDGKIWVWDGEDKTNGLLPSGVHIYYSDDLYNWVDKGLGFATYQDEADFEKKVKDPNDPYSKYYTVEKIKNDPDFQNVYGKDFKTFADDKSNYNMSSPEDALANVKYDLSVADSAVYERPKMVYNKATKRWVIWYHADGPIRGNPTSGSYSKAKAGVAISEGSDPAGPYKYLGSFRMSPGRNTGNPGMARDMNLYVDEGKDDNGDGVDDAYLIYASNNNSDLTISLLDKTYTKLVVPQAEQKQGTSVKDGATYAIAATNSKEAPAPVKYQGHYYIIYSGTTGWAPNENKVAVSENDSILGPYKEVGNPFVSGNGTNQSRGNAFTTQSSYVIPYDTAKGQYIYFADRWFNPDDNRDISQSRYVMTPIQFVGGSLRVLPAADWTTDLLDKYQSVDVVTKLPTEAGSASELVASLPKTLDVRVGDKTVKTPVSWTPYYGTDQSFGQVTINGTLPELDDIPVNVTATIYPKSAVLFMDAGSDPNNESDYYKTLVKHADDLINTKVSDQQYKAGAENAWGLSSVKGTDVEAYGTSDSDIYQTGYWAKGGKTIEYKADLKAGSYTVQAGYKEWWSNKRQTVFSVSADGKTLGETKIVPSGSGNATDQVKFTLDKDATVTFLTKSTSGGDPLLSWIGVAKVTADQAVSVAPVDGVKAFLDGGENGPDLPAKVTVTRADGKTEERKVTWQYNAKSLADFAPTAVRGVVEGTTLPATATVQRIPANLEYFIDVNGGDSSATYETAKSLTKDGLKNAKADQAYAEAEGWGNASTNYGKQNDGNADPYASGIFAGADGTAGTLSYKLTLAPGKHTVSVGLHDWWNVTRPTTVTYQYDGLDKAATLGTGNANGGNSVVSGTVEIPAGEAKVVTVTLTSSEGTGPVLNWVAATKQGGEPEPEPEPAKPVSAETVNLTVKAGETPELPGTVKVKYSDKSVKDVKVTWDEYDWAAEKAGKVVELRGDLEGIDKSVLRATAVVTLTDSGTTVPPTPLNAAPTIAGADDVTVTVGAKFDVLAGVTASDKEDGDLTKSIKVEGAVDTAKAGVYKLTYSVADSQGAKYTVVRTVTVKAKPGAKPADKQPGLSNTGASVSGVVGVVALLVAAAGVVFITRRRRD